MNRQTSLIERAAALLRDDAAAVVADVTSGSGRGAAAVAAPVTSAAALSPTRSFDLDHNRLAQVGILMPWTATARVVEEFRIVKRNIIFPWQMPDYPKTPNRPPRVVMVTSSRPREGKTFCSINLALAFAAEENLATILIDGDAMRGDTARVLGIPLEPGFTDLLTGQRRLQDALIQTDLPNLLIVPPGAHSPQIPELLSGNGPRVVFAEIAKRYPEHVILVDTAPCLASSDPTALATLAGHVVFVVEAGHTQQTEIESSLSMLSGCQQISFLLNKAPVGSSEHFGSYSYYYRPGGTAAKVGEY